MDFCLSYKAQWTKFNFETSDALPAHKDTEQQFLALKRITDEQRESSNQSKKGNIDIFNSILNISDSGGYPLSLNGLAYAEAISLSPAFCNI